jgi:glutathione S-transferase
MKLHWSPRSPFVRKVMIVLHEKGLLGEVELVRSVVMLDGPVNTSVLRDNPLGKIPALVLDDGQVLFDSRVICAYLDTLDGGAPVLPAAPAARFATMRWEALGDGLTDILVLWRSLHAKGIGADDPVSRSFQAKVRAALARLEAEAADLAAAEFSVGHAAIVCALGQLDFRYPACGWRAAHPALARWEAEVAKRPSVAATAIRDDSGGAMGEVAMPLDFGVTA